MKKWLIIAAVLVLTGCIVATCLGYNTWIGNVGSMAAGYLFGKA